MSDQPAVSVDHVAIGASSVSATVEFFAALGLTEVARRPVSAAAAATLYGLDQATEEVVLGVEGVAGGRLRVVATPLPRAERTDFFRGGHAIDFYTTDMARSVETAKSAGAKVGPVAEFQFGPVSLQQSMAIAPDGVEVVFVGISKRLPSVLDSRPDRLHSEVHSVVSAVDDIAAETKFWTEVVGLDLRSEFPIDVPAVSEFMMLPRHAPLRMSVLTGPDAAPPRYELLAYDDARGKLTPSRPLTAGSIVPVFRSADVVGTVERLVDAGATATGTVAVGATDAAGQETRERAAGLTTPGGVDLELRGPVE